MRRGRGAAALLIGCLAAAGCQGANARDLEGVPFRKPDKIDTYINIDGQPNFSRICVDGVALLTTSREMDAVLRVPEWDRWCKS